MILGIESSCDESALALFDPEKGLVGEWVHTQIALHKEYGGIVPDLASREHLTNFPVLLKNVLTELDGTRPDSIAVTCGPGLAGCLALGISMAKSLALFWNIDLCGVNHLRGHVFSPFISLHEKNPAAFAENFSKLLPHLGLIVSGGNTILFDITKERQLRILGQTVDDAAGEALDKGAKLLGLEYPGGPLIESIGKKGNPSAYDFPRAFHNSPVLKFSFSGLKTSLRYRLEKMSDTVLEEAMSDICASYQEAVVAALIRKTGQAMKKKRYRSMGLSGGVANNLRLREAFSTLAGKRKIPVYIADSKPTGDNAGMIAFAAFIDPNGMVLPANGGLSFQPALPLS